VGSANSKTGSVPGSVCALTAMRQCGDNATWNPARRNEVPLPEQILRAYRGKRRQRKPRLDEHHGPLWIINREVFPSAKGAVRQVSQVCHARFAAADFGFPPSPYRPTTSNTQRSSRRRGPRGRPLRRLCPGAFATITRSPTPRATSRSSQRAARVALRAPTAYRARTREVFDRDSSVPIFSEAHADPPGSPGNA